MTSPAGTEVIAAQREAPRMLQRRSTASVDSAPWLRFTPSACNPSYPPPVVRIPMSCPASLAPGTRPRRPGRRRANRSRRDGSGACARVGEGGHLDGLLIEAGRSLRPPAPAGVGDR